MGSYLINKGKILWEIIFRKDMAITKVLKIELGQEFSKVMILATIVPACQNKNKNKIWS